MTFFKSSKHQRLLWSLLLLSVGAAAGFGLGIFCGAEPPVGCRESDLTPVPDESFVSPASASSVETSPEPEPMPEKWVCLTFDDGPSKTTPDVLSALNSAGVKATFFVVATGNNDKYLPLISEAAAAGHQIALHSASHEYSDIYQSADAYWKDIDLLKERLSPYVRADGLRYLRFPGGSTNTVSRRYGGRGLMQQLKEEVTAKGYAYVDWNVCAEDAVGGKPSAGTIFRNIVRETGEQTQCIVLMHDSATTRTTAEALCPLVALEPSLTIGLTLGCLIANLFSTVSALDIIVGTAATLLACLLTRYIKKVWALPLPTILCNMLMVGAMLSAVFMPASEFWKGLAVFGAEVGAGEAVVLYILGIPLYQFIRKTKLIDKLLGRG